MAEPKGLTEGRIVHYVMPSGSHRRAIVVRVWAPSAGACSGYVNLTVFPDWSNDHSDIVDLIGADSSLGARTEGIIWQTFVCYDEETKVPRTWHYPEQV